MVKTTFFYEIEKKKKMKQNEVWCDGFLYIKKMSHSNIRIWHINKNVNNYVRNIFNLD